jgi:sec-independent protein translocase protein TatA
MPNIGPMELIVVLAIALMVLGPKRLPQAGKSLGHGIREFKNSISGNDDDKRPGRDDEDEVKALADEREHEPVA